MGASTGEVMKQSRGGHVLVAGGNATDRHAAGRR